MDPPKKPFNQVSLIVLSLKRPRDFDAVKRFRSVAAVWIQGNPTHMLDLERCSFRLARSIFVGPAPPGTLTDVQALFCTRLIEFAIGLGQPQTSKPMVFTELMKESSQFYIPLGLGPKVDHQSYSAEDAAQRSLWRRSAESKAYTVQAIQPRPTIHSARYANG